MESTVHALGYTFKALSIGPSSEGKPQEISKSILGKYNKWLEGPPVPWQFDDKNALLGTLRGINEQLKKNGGYVERALERLLYFNQSIPSQSVSRTDVLKMMLSTLVGDPQLHNVEDCNMDNLPDNPGELSTNMVYLVGVTIEDLGSHAVVMTYREEDDTEAGNEEDDTEAGNEEDDTEAGNEEDEEDDTEAGKSGWIIFDPNGSKSQFARKLLDYLRKDKRLASKIAKNKKWASKIAKNKKWAPGIANIDDIHGKVLNSKLFEYGMGLARGMGWCQLWGALTVMFLLQGRSVKTIEEFYRGEAFDYDAGNEPSNSDLYSDSDEEWEPDSSLVPSVDPDSFLMVTLRQACVVFYRNLCEGIKDNPEISDAWRQIFVLSPKTSVGGMGTFKLYGFDVTIDPPDTNTDKDAPVRFLLGYQKWNKQHALLPERGQINAFVRFTFENSENSQPNLYSVGLHLRAKFLYEPYFSDKWLSDCIAYKMREAGVVDYTLDESDLTLHELVLYAEKGCSEENYKIIRNTIRDGIEDVVIDCSEGLITAIRSRLRAVYDTRDAKDLYVHKMPVNTRNNFTIRELKDMYKLRFGDCLDLKKYGSDDPSQNPLLLYKRYEKLLKAFRKLFFYKGDLKKLADDYDDEAFEALSKIQHWKELVFQFNGVEYEIKFRKHADDLEDLKHFAIGLFLVIASSTQGNSLKAKLIMRNSNHEEIKSIDLGNRPTFGDFQDYIISVADDFFASNELDDSDSDDPDAMVGIDKANILPKRKRDLSDVAMLLF